MRPLFPAPIRERSRVTRVWLIGAVVLLGAAGAHAGQVGSPKPAPAVGYTLVSRETIEARLGAAPRNNQDREPAIESMFEQAGCKGSDLVEQPVKHERFPNVICHVAGSTDSTIIVGAHFDKVSRGGGVVDNWSGASLLTSLFESLHDRPRKHTFIFVSFTAEEEGLVGSKFYVSSMTPDDIARTRAMVNIDTLALGTTNIWLTHSDRKLAGAFYAVAQSMKLPVAIVNADHVGNDDSDSFLRRKVPTLMLHSITNRTFHVLHTDDDNLSAVRFGDYYDSYRLIAAYLAWIDTVLD
jgi:putative aminopeptidase FrvX